jgi:hypothetical protein
VASILFRVDGNVRGQLVAGTANHSWLTCSQNKIDVSKLSEEEQVIFKKYGTLPSLKNKNLLANKQTVRPSLLFHFHFHVICSQHALMLAGPQIL